MVINSLLISSMYRLGLKWIYVYLICYFGTQMVFSYSFDACACVERKHMQFLMKLNGGRDVSCFFYWF